MLSTISAVTTGPDAVLTGTRERILLTAIRLFAAHGFHGVSLRAINEQAGARNGSAVQYHFRNREGLIAAVVEFIAGEMFPEARQRLARLKADAARRRIDVREIVEATFGPALAYSLKPGIGIAAAQILPLLAQDSDPKIRQLFADTMGDMLSKAERLLCDALPGKPSSVVRLQLGFALVNVVHLVTDLHVPYGADSAVVDPQVLIKVYDHFLDYTAAGLASERRGSDRFRAELLAGASA